MIENTNQFELKDYISNITSALFIHYRRFLLFLIYRLGMRTFLKMFIGTTFSSNEAIRNEKQYIIVANHNSHVDTMAILSSLPTKSLPYVHPVAAGDYFGKTSVTSLFFKVMVNTKLINRENGGRETINSIDRMLKRGRSIIIFPEGSRGEAGVLQDFKKGVAILLKNNPQIPYIPIYLDGLDKVMPKGDGMPIPYNSNVQIGKATRVNANDSIEKILLDMKNNIVNLK
ncbi:1-acyl-sn-glycerol-3-phosphate acyltransferase [Halobacteriovorax sp. HLS]|uniref:lysophospholipid acyltransferase family protein n=1 Tax=Halobacteriovorax sp. HLS TaxID=2234000 RepID=UPI000FDB3FA3|nr:lysophospholipid acyltransferase family protein [Halobacteriovorax sp. HLS]